MPTEYRIYSASIIRPDNRHVPPEEAEAPYVAIGLGVGKSTKYVQVKLSCEQSLLLAEQLITAVRRLGSKS